MRIAIMQPTYLPWLGYFDIMDQVELFVFLDNVQFVKQSWHVRNRIKTPKGLEWLTVPVILHGRFGQLINEAEIRMADFWKKHVRAIEVNYRRAPYFQDYFSDLLSVFEQGKPWIHLVDLNITLITWLSGVLGVKNRSLRSSHLEVEGKRSTLIATICQSLEATEYLSPIGSAAYLLDEIQEFANRGIKVFLHNYQHPTYHQLFSPFVPFASVIDLVFNEGPRSMEIIRSGRGSAYLPEDVREKGTENGRDNG